MHELLAQGELDEILSNHIDALAYVRRTAEDREDLLLLTSLRDCPSEHKTLHPGFCLLEPNVADPCTPAIKLPLRSVGLDPYFYKN